jgi:hypothetical protein
LLPRPSVTTSFGRRAWLSAAAAVLVWLIVYSCFYMRRGEGLAHGCNRPTLECAERRLSELHLAVRG